MELIFSFFSFFIRCGAAACALFGFAVEELANQVFQHHGGLRGGDGVALAHHRAKPCCYLLQQPVAMVMAKGMTEGVGPAHAKSFYTDLVDDSGRLNEVRLALRTEGVSTLARAGMAITLLRQGKMDPLEVFGGETIEGHDALVKMIQAAHAAEKE